MGVNFLSDTLMEKIIFMLRFGLFVKNSYCSLGWSHIYRHRGGGKLWVWQARTAAWQMREMSTCCERGDVLIWLLFFFFWDFLFILNCVCMCVCLTFWTRVQVLLEVRRGPVAGAIGNCGLPDIGAEAVRRATDDSLVCPWWDDSNSFWSLS